MQELFSLLLEEHGLTLSNPELERLLVISEKIIKAKKESVANVLCSEGLCACSLKEAKMYLIIDSDYRLTKCDILTGEIRAAARRGEISLVDCKRMIGMNSAECQAELGEWSEIEDHYKSEESI